MQSGATASGPGSKHPEQEQLFDVFEVREWGGNSLEKVELKINNKDITILLLKIMELTPVHQWTII